MVGSLFRYSHVCFVMKFTALTVLFLSAQVWCQQPVPIVVALNNEMNRYRQLAEYAVQVSMNISIMVSGMNEEVFIKSDELESRAMLLEDAVITKAQEVSPRSVKAGDCVQNMKILRSIKEMKTHVQQSTKCLHDEANINSMLETMVTTTLNHQRSHVIEGRRAMEKCSSASDPTFCAKCLDTISDELVKSQTLTVASMKKIQRQTSERKKQLTGKMRICESLSSKFIGDVLRSIHKLEHCEKLFDTK